MIGKIIIDQETDISQLNKSIGLHQNDTQDASQNVSPTSVTTIPKESSPKGMNLNVQLPSVQAGIA